jgi:GntR family transcriptional regulator / MocR family aminotransferase
MGVDWSGIGPELLLVLDRTSGKPLGRQLQDELRSAIRSGRLPPGERLPATRVLASQLGVSRGLVVDAYDQLDSEGYVESMVGSGTVVAAGVVAPAPRLTAGPKRRLEVDFEYGVPDLGAFPSRDWSWSLSEACRTATIGDIGDEPGTGSQTLRSVLASYLGRVRNSSVDPEAVVVCQGFRQGLNVVLRALAQHGVGVVALEDPGPIDHDTIAQRAGMTAVHVPVDDRGIDVEALVRTAARAVVVTPAHQCPTGVLLAPERRHALVEWARRVDGYVIEDDYDAEFRYDRQPVGSMQGLAPDRVIAMGSVSKTLAPALRLGWIVSPPELIDRIGVEKQLLGRGAPALDQLALAVMIESGRFDRHLRHMRSVYGNRRDTLVAAIAEHAPGVVVTGLAAGCHAVLRLPAGVAEHEVVATARERSVGLYGMSGYRSVSCPGVHAELVIGFGGVSDGAITRAIARVADLLRPA